LEADPKNSANLVNFAGFLFANGQFEEGRGVLERFLETTYTPAAELEARFYQFAHAKDAPTRMTAKAAISELLALSVRSPGWNLRDNVVRALQDGHPEPEALERFASTIVQPLSKATGVGSPGPL
jgi:hypothetical protein